MNAQLRKAMYHGNIARNKFRKYGEQYWQEKHRQRNLVVSLRMQSLRKYFPKDALKRIKFLKDHFTFYDKQAHYTWQQYNYMILREGDNTAVDNKAVCENFNDYFANIASSIGFEDTIFLFGWLWLRIRSMMSVRNLGLARISVIPTIKG